jgi:hypothetical protein
MLEWSLVLLPYLRVLRVAIRFNKVRKREKDAKLAQKLVQLQPL